MKPTGTQTRLKLGRKPLGRPHGCSHSSARGLSGAWATFHQFLWTHLNQSHWMYSVRTSVLPETEPRSHTQAHVLSCWVIIYPPCPARQGNLALFLWRNSPWDGGNVGVGKGKYELWSRDSQALLGEPPPRPPFSIIDIEKRRWCRHSSCWWPDRQFPQRYMRPFGVPVRRLAAEWHQWGRARIPSGNTALIDRQRQREGLFLNLKRIPFFSP